MQCSPAFIKQNIAMWLLWIIPSFVFLFGTIFITIWQYLSNSHCNWTGTAGLRQSSIFNAYLQNQFTSESTSQMEYCGNWQFSDCKYWLQVLEWQETALCLWVSSVSGSYCHKTPQPWRKKLLSWPWIRSLSATTTTITKIWGEGVERYWSYFPSLGGSSWNSNKPNAPQNSKWSEPKCGKY